MLRSLDFRAILNSLLSNEMRGRSKNLDPDHPSQGHI